MRELIVNFTRLLATEFNDKTVGSGGDFGATLSNGPFTIKTFFHQWEEFDHQSGADNPVYIHTQIIQEKPVSDNFECCGGPTSLLLNIRISVLQKGQGWSIAEALYEALRDWLCNTNYSYAPGDEDYLVILDQASIYANHVYEGDVFSINTTVALTYLRGFES